MAKKGKKKDPAKKFALQAAKEAKADKKAQKRLQKEARREQAKNGEDGDNFDSKGGANDNHNEEENIDELLASFQKQNLELSTPLIETLQSDTNEIGSSSFPYPPRGNFTLTLCPTSNELYMFGGEYFNGVENVVFDELLCWNPDAKPSTDDEEVKKNHKGGVWKRIIAPLPRPPARCSHSTVYYNNALYVFGGELATAQNYLHYKDIWKFDIKTNLWSEIKPRNKGGPTSRSGHRTIVWRHYMLIFGGFFEALRESPRWFNDLHVYDFSTNSWIDCTYSKLASIPPERSAFNFGIYTGGSDVAYVTGGYSKLKNPAPGTKAEGLVHTDYWALHLKGLESGKIPKWERLSRKGEYPSERSGTACTMWKNKMLVFGGVQDEETENHRVKSVFFDDLFAFDMERKRWFRLNLKKKAGERRRRRKDDNDADKQVDEVVVNEEDSDEDDRGIEGEATSSGWDLDMLRSNMFAFIDGEGNVVYEKIEEDETAVESGKVTEPSPSSEVDTGYEADEGEKEISSSNVEDSITLDPQIPSVGNDEVLQKMAAPGPALTLPSINKSEVMVLGEDGAPIPVARKTPLPRIKAQIVVRGNTLYLYGGILEVGDREVTLDDVWSLELQKREEWVCIHAGSMYKQVWKGVDSDNESYISTDRGTGGDESDDEDDFYEFDDILEEGEDEEEAKAARKAAKKAAKKERMKGIREEIKTLNEQLNAGDSNESPQAGEELADFYARTSVYWTQKAADSREDAANDELSVKELKREGFNLAQSRYEELKHVLDRLQELEADQEESKDKKERKEKKKSKKDKKDKDKKKDRRR